MYSDREGQMFRLKDGRDAVGDSGEDGGFTLIEIIVVLLILAILIAIAIPTFLGLTGGASDRAAQSNLNVALTNAKSAAISNGQTYSGVNITGNGSLASSEPAIQWVVAAGQGFIGPGPVSTYLDPAGNGIVLASFSRDNDGTCWYAVDNLKVVGDAPVGPYRVANFSTGAGATDPTVVGTFYGVSPGSTSAQNCDASSTPSAATHWSTRF
jgi:type IV pilus assembly protein PilA